MGMCYLYGHRFQAQEDDLIRAIRNEIYVQSSYGNITDWTAFRSYVNTVDLLKPKSSAQSVMVSTMSIWESFVRLPAVNGLCARGLDKALFQPLGLEYGPALRRWLVNVLEGLVALGTDGNAVWETSLSISAIYSSTQLLTDNDLCPASLESRNAALRFLGDSQLLHNSIGIHRTYRHLTKGGWPYGTRTQGYIVSDVTAETLMAIMQGYQVPGVLKQILIEHLQLAVDSLIGLECGGSGFAAYQHVRGWEMVELCNITDTYEDCMMKRCYAEITGAVMMARAELHDGSGRASC
ncbi:hypothetical protein F4782DRAFT_552456 [Xylaria castorea]|nr:hypothetical protein F4782DRAFT_552456 [Xylaria castorea]